MFIFKYGIWGPWDGEIPKSWPLYALNSLVPEHVRRLKDTAKPMHIYLYVRLICTTLSWKWSRLLFSGSLLVVESRTAVKVVRPFVMSRIREICHFDFVGWSEGSLFLLYRLVIFTGCSLMMGKLLGEAKYEREPTNRSDTGEAQMHT
jgi:hypothetical protein